MTQGNELKRLESNGSHDFEIASRRTIDTSLKAVGTSDCANHSSKTLSITQSDPADPGRRPSCCTSRRSRIEDGPQDARQIASRARTEHRGRRRLQADAALRVAPAGCALCSCRLCKATTRLITIRPCVHTGGAGGTVGSMVTNAGHPKEFPEHQNHTLWNLRDFLFSH